MSNMEENYLQLIHMEKCIQYRSDLPERKDAESTQNEVAFFCYGYYDRVTRVSRPWPSYFSYKDVFAIKYPYKKSDQPIYADQLFSLISEKNSMDPFVPDKESPFLGIFLLTVITEEEKMFSDVVSECMVELGDNLKKQFRECACGIYRTLNCADICVVLRTNKLGDIYRLKRNIKAYVSGATDTRNFKTVLTIASAGPEILEEGKFTDEIVELNKSQMLELRFESDVNLQEKIEDLKDDGISVIGTGGIGEYAMFVPFEKFSEAYDSYIKIKQASELDQEKEGDSAIVRFLKCHQGNLTFTYERWLFELEDSAAQELSNNAKRESYFRLPLKLYGLMLKKVKESEVLDFPAESGIMTQLYTEQRRLLRDLLYTYNNFWYQKASARKGVFFYAQLEALLEGIEQQIAVLNKPQEQQKFTLKVLYDDLIYGMQLMIAGINSFSKLLLTANFQIRNVPNYEIQTKVNVEKYLYAYNMFLIKICQAHYALSRKAGENELVFPVFFMNLSTGRVGAYTVFPKLEGEEESKKWVRTFLISCPNYQRFANVYHVLPMITHEISHSFRYLSRRDRNQYIFRYLIKEYSVQIANCILENDTRGNYPLSNRKEWSFVAESIERMLSQEVLARYEANLEQIHLKNILDCTLEAVEDICGIYAQKKQNSGNLCEYLQRKMEEVFKLTEMRSDEPSLRGAEASDQINHALKLLLPGHRTEEALDEIENALINMAHDFSEEILKIFELKDEEYKKGCSKIEDLLELLGTREEDVTAKIREFVQQFSSADENRQQYMFDQLSLLFADFSEIFELLDQLRPAFRSEQVKPEVFLVKLHQDLYEQYQAKLKNCRKDVLSEDRWILRNSVQEKYTRIGILNPMPDQFCGFFSSKMMRLNLEAFSEDGEEYLRRYDEVCADLGMCEAFGFSYFGYFCYIIRLFMKERNIPKNKFTDMTEERVALVIKTLYAREKGVNILSEEQLGALQQCMIHKIIAYGMAVLRNHEGMTEDVILDMNCPDKAWSAIQEAVRDYENKCKKGSCEQNYEILRWMVTLFYSMNLKKSVIFHEDQINHFCMVKERVEKSGIFECCKSDKTIVAIGEYYNTYDKQVNNELREKQCMEKQNEFVLNNYEQCMQMCNAWKKSNLDNNIEKLSKMPDIIEWMYTNKEE